MEDYKLIKNISIVDYLESNGYTKVNGSTCNYAKFKSPFTNEKTASFVVKLSTNTFHDYSANIRGNMNDLMTAFKNQGIHTSVVEFMTCRSSKTCAGAVANYPLEIISVEELTDTRLLDYIVHKRGINVSIAKYYCKQIKYTIKNRIYLAIGFKNNKGGWELRNEKFKGGTVPKAITTFEGNSEKHNVFEGFMDYLSALTFYKSKRLKYSTHILNSTVFAESLSSEMEYNIFTDNDPAGNGVIEVLAPNNIINDFRDIFAPHNDFNDYLVSLKNK